MKGFIWGESFIDEAILKYLVFEDVYSLPPNDYILLPYAIRLEKAYLKLYKDLGLLNEEEYRVAINKLDELLELRDELSKYEDVHSFIEKILSKEIGKYPYICRSRNESICIVERLYAREYVYGLLKEIENFIEISYKICNEAGSIPIPIHTHYRLADVIPLISLITSYLEELNNILDTLINTVKVLLTSPIGSGAIGGCIVEIDKTEINRELGFKFKAYSSVYGVMSRKIHLEKILYLNSSILALLARISNDFIRLSGNPYNIIKLSEDILTGSSQIIHKKNPDIFEIIKGKYVRNISFLNMALNILNDESGYQRYIQEMKRPFIISIFDTLGSLKTVNLALTKIYIISGFRDEEVVKTWFINTLSYRYRINYRDLFLMARKEKNIEMLLNKISTKYNINIEELKRIYIEVGERKYNNSMLGNLDELISDMRNKIGSIYELIK